MLQTRTRNTILSSPNLEILSMKNTIVEIKNSKGELKSTKDSAMKKVP